MEINTNNKVIGLPVNDFNGFFFTQLYQNREQGFCKQVTLSNCRQGNHIPQSRKVLLSKSLDALQSQWKNYKIRHDHLASKNVLQNVVKQKQKNNMNSPKKRFILKQKYQIQHKRVQSNTSNLNNKQAKKLTNSANNLKQDCRNIVSANNSRENTLKKQGNFKFYVSPQKQEKQIKLMLQQQKQKCETDRLRLSLQNKGRPSKSSLNILVKQLKELKDRQDQGIQLKQNNKISLQKPKLKITLNTRKVSSKNCTNFSISDNCFESKATLYSQNQKSKCKLKLSRNKIQNQKRQEDAKKIKCTYNWAKKCQISATVRPYQNLKKQQISIDKKKHPFQQKKFGAIQKCNQKTLRITHKAINETDQLSQKKQNSSNQQAKQRKLKNGIVSFLQSQQKINIQKFNRKNSSVGYMQIQDIIRMTYNKNGNNLNFDENYFSLTTRS